MQFKESVSGYSLQDLQDFAFKWTEALHRAAYETWTYKSQTNSQLTNKGLCPNFRMYLVKFVFKELLDSPNCEASLTIFGELEKELEKIIKLNDKKAETPFLLTTNHEGKLWFNSEEKAFAKFIQKRHQRGLNCYKELDDVFKSTQKVSVETSSPIDADALNSDATEDTPQIAQNASKKRTKM